MGSLEEWVIAFLSEVQLFFAMCVFNCLDIAVVYAVNFANHEFGRVYQPSRRTEEMVGGGSHQVHEGR
jgi:hypothetical protein